MVEKRILSISKCTLFRGIPPEELESLFSSHHITGKEYHKGALVRFQGDDYSELLIITKGELSAEILNPDGKRIIIETLKESSAIATGILFAGDNSLPVTLKANSDVSLVAVSRMNVIRFCHENEKFLTNYLQDMGDKVLFLAEKIRLFKFKSINQKIAGYLLNLAVKQGTESVRMTYSREQLADLFGVARPSLSRVLSEFYDLGILEHEGKIMHIIDKENLEDILRSE